MIHRTELYSSHFSNGLCHSINEIVHSDSPDGVRCEIYNTIEFIVFDRMILPFNNSLTISMKQSLL